MRYLFLFLTCLIILCLQYFNRFKDNSFISSGRYSYCTLKLLTPLKMKALYSFKMLGTDYPVMWNHIPEEWNPHS